MIALPRKTLVWLLFGLSCLHGFGAENAAPGPALGLTDVVRLLGERNPRISAEREAIASARADRETAAAYPNPKLGLNHQEPQGDQTLFTGQRQEQVSVEFPILLPGQYFSRVAKADADLAAATAQVRATVDNVTADGVASFMQLLALQRRSEILSNSLAAATRLRETISGRLAGGASSQYDLARVEVEVSVLAGQLDTAHANLAAESGRLASLLGITNGLPAAVGELRPWEIPSRYLFDPAAQTAVSPVALAAQKEAAAAENGVKAARRSRWPELSLSGGRAWTAHPYGAANFVGLDVEIPIFDTRRGSLDKAKSDARAAEARQAATLAEVEAALRQLSESIQRNQAALSRYETEIEPRLARLKEMSTDAYLMGRHTILELLDAEQTHREILLGKIETLSSLIEAQIRLLAITGQLSSFIEPSRAKDSHR